MAVTFSCNAEYRQAIRFKTLREHLTSWRVTSPKTSDTPSALRAQPKLNRARGEVDRVRHEDFADFYRYI